MATSRTYILLSLFILLGVFPARASHIVGGEVTYRYLGSNQYRITIDIYQDCKDGLPEAIKQDNPALIGIFYNGGAYMSVFPDGFDSIKAQADDIIDVPANFSNSCVTKAPAVCLTRIRFEKDYYLPPSPLGYVVVYQRCCRNASIVNIINPGNIGATYSCIIPPNSTAPQPNNSAVFKNYPPQIICVNEPLVYDHSATDADGDSLSYEFCQTYAGGLPDDAKPLPQPPDPQFPLVAYAPPFSYPNPMGGSPRIQIDPKDGVITGTPTSVNRFVVTVCCHEWRNGVMINTVTREFQFVVADCKKAVVANTPVFSDLPNTYIVNCRNKTVQFKNTSIGGFEYFWTFGDGATSTEFEPVHTYADTGVYNVKLFVNRGSTCPDSISRVVKIYPTFIGDYSITGLLCPNNYILFADSSETTYGDINYWSWDFGDSEFDGNQYTAHKYKQGGIYKVVMYSGNSLGCRDTVAKTIDVDKFYPFAGNDTIIVKGERIDFNATGGIEYTWTPGDQGLTNTNIPNPSAFYPDTGTYHYAVHIKSSYGCEGDAYINVRVVSNPSYFVPNAFTPNGDGLNDFLRPRAVGYRSVDFFRVFNRFGELVFEGKDFAIGWDGRWKGEYADVGTYMYVLKLTNRFGVVEWTKGDAILIR